MLNLAKTNKLFKLNYLLIFSLVVCLGIVAALFIPTLGRPWLHYDEGIISLGAYYPQVSSFGEIIEFIKEFGLSHTLVSSNTIYSSNYITRSCPLDQLLGMIMTLFFKRDPFSYHLFNLTLHLINTTLVFFILRTLTDKKLWLIGLTSIWAVHPVIIEAVLLSTNWGALIAYTFFFGFFLDFLLNREKNSSLLRRILIPILFVLILLKNEQIVFLPFVLLVISFYRTYKENSFKQAFKLSLVETLPYFIGFFVFAAYVFFFSNYHLTNSSNKSLLLFIERVLWLSPQLFVHHLKLIFYPKLLTTDQSIFVKLGKTILDPYSVFCSVVFISFLAAPLIAFLFKKKLSKVFLFTWAFFLTLLPFLHIITPSYTLVSERYLYAPLAVFVFGIAHFLTTKPKKSIYIALGVTFLITTSLCFARSYYRTLDWQNSRSLINATYKTANNSLFKAIRLGMLGKSISNTNKEKSKEYFKQTLSLLQKAREEITILRDKYQDGLPQVIKSYGLDYNSLLAKVAYLEVSSRCIELNEHHSVGLKILKPYMENSVKVDANTFELYNHLLIFNKEYKKAKELLLKANSLYPHISFILRDLMQLSLQYENDKATAGKYLQEALKYYPYDINFLAKAFMFYQGHSNPLITAKHAYKYGLRINSDIAYNQALAIYLETNTIKKAKKVVDRILKANFYNADSHYLASKYYYKAKDFKKAAELLETAYFISFKESKDQDKTKKDKAFDTGYTLANLYLLAGDKYKAKLTFNSLKNFFGDNKTNLQKLSVLSEKLNN